MVREMSRTERTIETAEFVSELLTEMGIDNAVIGAMALGVHGYARGTDDFDLGVIIVQPSITFRKLASRLEDDFDVEFRLPDDSDPLGGVLVIEGEDIDPIEVVNFINLGNLAAKTPGPDAVRSASEGLIEDSPLRVVSLPYLIALKLYAGGFASLGDAVKLLEHNPDADLEAIRAVCRQYDLGDQFDAVVGELE